MTLSVVFDIKLPLVSWGEGGASYTPTDLVPTWSALTGLVGAAFGWQRTDERLVEFAASYAPAVRVIKAGGRLLDYQTIQSPHRPALSGVRPMSRRAELQATKRDGSPYTTITQREYVQECEYEIALVPIARSPIVGTQETVDALNSPRYPLYAGRRSCPLGHIGARQSNSLDALAVATHWDERISVDRDPSVIRERRDLLVSVAPRRFALRLEAVA